MIRRSTLGLLVISACGGAPAPSPASVTVAPVATATAPSAEDQAAPAVDAPVVVIAGSNIVVDGDASGNTRAVEDSKRQQVIDELFNNLASKKNMWGHLHPGKTFPGAFVLRVEATTPAVVVKSVVQTAASAGYPKVHLTIDKSQTSRANP